MPLLTDTIRRQRELLMRRESLLMLSLVSDYANIKRIIPKTVTKDTDIRGIARQVQKEIALTNNRFLEYLRPELRLMVVTAIEHVVQLDEVLETGQLMLTNLEKRREVSPKAFANTQKYIREAVKEALKKNPILAMKDIEKIVATSFTRAVTISRNEVYTTYRDTQLDVYKKNTQDFDGWVWVSQADSRTCPLCWSMHGTKHDVEEEFISHARCRCTTIPYAEGTETLTEGSILFDDLFAEDKQKVLGPGKYKLYKSGDLKLSDLVVKDTNQYGSFLKERSLKDLS